MEVIHPRCAGLDVHLKTVVACARLTSGGQVSYEQRTFLSSSEGLEALRGWLQSLGCTHVGMEATGVYWKPVWHVLDGHFELTLANARRLRHVPGRKSDTSDAQWLADLLACGLVSKSFVAPAAIQELRDLTRTRSQLMREISRHTQRIAKVLEDANIKLSTVVSQLLGRTGRKVLQALIAGESDSETLAGLRHNGVKASREEFVAALRGHISEHHRFLLRMHLEQIEHLEKAVADLEAQIAKQTQPFRRQLELLSTIPGVKQTAACAMLAEHGADMRVFPSAAHLVSWAGVCPRQEESAGKKKSTRIRSGDKWLRTVLVQAAWAAVRAKRSALSAQYYRLKTRRGPQKAIVAVAASLLTCAYYVLLRDQPYRDWQVPREMPPTVRARTAKRLVARLQDLGYQVNLKVAA